MRHGGPLPRLEICCNFLLVCASVPLYIVSGKLQLPKRVPAGGGGNAILKFLAKFMHIVAFLRRFPSASVCEYVEWHK